jgi:hypothetical protein
MIKMTKDIRLALDIRTINCSISTPTCRGIAKSESVKV